ncbi:holin [Mycobacterium phage Turbido]|uniref:Holin n=3 Tax=Turbidovirus turbido TaxID=1993865 RepID=A0A1D8EZQ1_9CAUD|nr:holin [Mycobacterium phage Turbido]AEL17749.1 holin [Mycobacterium phage Turbido]AOT27697.1 holin [Mycobacterium phage Jerm]AYD86561.1 holin [Mycobacterium phage LilTurb]
MSPKIRQSIYHVGTLIPGLVGLAMLWFGLSSDDADSIIQVISGALALIGAGAPAIAAKTVRDQRKDGTLTASPVEAVSKGIEQVIAARDAAQAEVEKVTSVVGNVLNDVQLAANAVNLGPLASQILSALPVDHQPPTAYSLYDPNNSWRRPEDR